MDLRDGGGGDGRRETLEDCLDRPAEIFCDHLARFAFGKRLDLVAQSSQRLRRHAADDVRPRRQKLPELHVRGAEPVKRRGQPLRPVLRRHAAPLDEPRGPHHEARHRRQRVDVDEAEGAFARENKTGVDETEESAERH